MKESAFDDLLTAAYRCPGDVEAWTSLTERMRDAFGSRYVHVVLFDMSARVRLEVADEPEAGREYARDYAHRDVAVPRIMASPAGQAHWSHTLLSRDELARCPVQNELLPRVGVGSRTWVHSPVGDGLLFTTSILHRSTSNGLDELSMRHLESLHGHLRQSMHLHLTVEAARAERISFEAGLEAVATGVVLIDRSGRVSFANRVARDLFTRGRLRVNAGRIGAPKLADDAALRKITASALNNVGPALAAVAEFSDLRVRAIPIVDAEKTFDRTAAAVLLFHDTASPELDPSRLLSLGLTPAEAVLAVALGAGETLESYAARTGRALGTVRAQLRSIFGKTNTHRQSELVLLVARTAAGE